MGLFFVCFVFKDGFRISLPGTQQTQIPNPPSTLSFGCIFKQRTAFPAASPLLCILHAFPLFLSLSPLVIWPHLNESKKIKGPDYIQSSCHGLWEGRIANTSVQMVQSFLPPSPQPCSCPPCPHFPLLRGSHRRPLALGGEELNLFKHPDTSSVHQ